MWPNFAFQRHPGGAVDVWKWAPVDERSTHLAVDWFFPAADLKKWQRNLIEHHATTTFAEDFPLVENVQLGLRSAAYEPGPLMIDDNESVLSEHGVAAIQDLWRGMMGDPGDA